MDASSQRDQVTGAIRILIQPVQLKQPESLISAWFARCILL